MKFKHLAFLIGVMFNYQSLQATVTLAFNGDSSSGLIAGLANSAGVATNGMRWGIVVSTSNTSFEGMNATGYDPFGPGPTTAGFLNFGGSASDDYYIPGGLTLDTSTWDEGNFTFKGGAGGIGNDITGIALTGDASGVGLGAGITTGDKFALIWFSENTSGNGSNYGMLSIPQFLIPSNGAFEDSYLSAFEGNDPIRAASFTFGGASVVPEPSRLMLLGLGFFGLFFRRRR